MLKKKGLNKSGQITVIIIIGIILLLVFATIIFITSTINKSGVETAEEQVTSELTEGVQVKAYIEHCLEKSTTHALINIGSKGGYVGVPMVLDYYNTSLWFVDQVNVQPTLEEIQHRVESYIQNDIGNCLDYSIFEAQGFNVTFSEPISSITFSSSRTISELYYTITLRKGDSAKEFKQFKVELEVPFRKLFEAASQIINLQMEKDFKSFYPLGKFNNSEVSLKYSSPDNEHLVYIISPKEQNGNEAYSLSFASKLGTSTLIKRIALQENSPVIPTTLPLALESIDKKAVLLIAPGTTLNLDGTPVPEISIQQAYSPDATLFNVPVAENLDDSVDYGNITWVLTYPVYQFEPTGMRFNSPQRLVLYWDEYKVSAIGPIGILYTEGEGWRPLPAKANYEQHYVYTDIPGFSNFTAVDCGKQSHKSASASAKIEPGWGCIARWIITIVVIAIIVAVIILSAGAATPVAPGLAIEAGTTLSVPAGTAVTVSTAAGPVTLAGTATGGVAAVGTTGATAGAVSISGGVATFTTAGTVTGVTLSGGALAGVTGGALVSASGAVATGFFGTLGAVFAGGLTFLGYAVVIGGALVGGTLLNAAMAFGSGHDSITFTPTCDQNITISISEHGGEGMCSPSSGKEEVSGGNPIALSAQVQKCNFVRNMFCVDCSIECSTSYK